MKASLPLERFNLSTAERGHGRGFVLFDIQMVTPATKPLGAIEIPRRAYLQRLSAAVAMKCSFG